MSCSQALSILGTQAHKWVSSSADMLGVCLPRSYYTQINMTPLQFFTLNPALTTAICQDLPAGTSICLAAPTVRLHCCTITLF